MSKYYVITYTYHGNTKIDYFYTNKKDRDNKFEEIYKSKLKWAEENYGFIKDIHKTKVVINKKKKNAITYLSKYWLYGDICWEPERYTKEEMDIITDKKYRGELTDDEKKFEISRLLLKIEEYHRRGKYETKEVLALEEEVNRLKG